MFYILMSILFICFLLTVYRAKKLKENHTLYVRVGILIYVLLASVFLVAILI